MLALGTLRSSGRLSSFAGLDVTLEGVNGEVLT